MRAPWRENLYKKPMVDRVRAEKRGHRSETLAALWLRLKGYRILGRRIKTHLGEIDLVARSPRGIVCFVEVKARADLMTAAQAVGPRQRTRIARAASLYLAARPDLARGGVRFDIVAVAPHAWPRHFPDAWRPQ
jgi:putative endonuclease